MRKMKFNIFVFLIIAMCVDIGLSKPLNHLRKKRQLGGTGVSFGTALKTHPVSRAHLSLVLETAWPHPSGPHPSGLHLSASRSVDGGKTGAASGPGRSATPPATAPPEAEKWGEMWIP